MRAAAALVVVSLVTLLPTRSIAFGLDAVSADAEADARLSKIEHAAGVCADRVEDKLHHEQMIRLVLRDESIVPGRYRGIEDGRLLLWQSPDDHETGELTSHDLESIQRVNYTTTGGIQPQWPLAGAAVGFLGGMFVFHLTQSEADCGEWGCFLGDVAWGLHAGGIGALIGMALSPFLPTSHEIACVARDRRRRLE